VFQLRRHDNSLHPAMIRLGLRDARERLERTRPSASWKLTRLAPSSSSCSRA
jgi:hypothetical protein